MSFAINCRRPHPFWFDLNDTVRNVAITSGVVTSDEDGDASIQVTTGADVSQEHSFGLALSYSYMDGSPDFSFTSSNEAVATVDASGVVTPVAAGNATITVIGSIEGTSVTRNIELTQTVVEGTTMNTIVGGVTGSARKSITDVIDAAISGKTPSVAKPLFSAANHVTGAYTYNASGWFYPWVTAMTGLSPWNSNGGTEKAGVAVTARNAIGAAHYGLNIGNTIRFVQSNGTVVDRVISAYSDMAGTDIRLYVLSSDLPAGITPAKMFPSDWTEHFTVGPSGGGRCESMPIAWIDKINNVYVHSVELYMDGSTIGAELDYGLPVGVERLSFSKGLTMGDSGSPFFVMVGSNLALLTSAYGWGASPSYPVRLSAMQSAISTLNATAGVGAYSLTTVDFSAFTNFTL